MQFLKTIFNYIYHEFINYPVYINLSYMWNLGIIAGICLVLQIFTSSSVFVLNFVYSGFLFIFVTMHVCWVYIIYESTFLVYHINCVEHNLYFILFLISEIMFFFTFFYISLFLNFKKFIFIFLRLLNNSNLLLLIPLFTVESESDILLFYCFIIFFFWFFFKKIYEFLLFNILLLCYKQIVYFFQELFKPITYTWSYFQEDLRLDSFNIFEKWLEPQIDKCEISNDIKKLNILLQLKPPLIKFWSFRWWWRVGFMFMWIFVNLHRFFYGLFCLFYLIIKQIFSKQLIEIYNNKRLCVIYYWFGLPVQLKDPTKLIYLDPQLGRNFSWQNFYRIYTFTNCIFFTISSVFYLYNIFLLNNSLFLSKLWAPGLFIFLFCLYLSLLFADIFLPFIALKFKKLVVLLPCFFENCFFPLFYFIYYFERIFLVLIFYMTFKVYLGFLLIFFFWYVLKFLVLSSLLIILRNLSPNSNSDYSSFVSLSSYSLTSISYFSGQFYSQLLLKLGVSENYIKKIVIDMFFIAGYPALSYVGTTIVKKQKKLSETFSKKKVSVSSGLMNLWDSIGFDPMFTPLDRPVKWGLDVKLSPLRFTYPIYLVNFISETMPIGFEAYVSLKKYKKILKKLNTTGTRQFHSTSILRFPGGKGGGELTKVTLDHLFKGFTQYVSTTPSISLPEVKLFLSEPVFTGFAAYGAPFNQFISRNISNDSINNIEQINENISRLFFTKPFLKDHQLSLANTITESITVDSLKLKCPEIFDIFRLGVSGSHLDAFFTLDGVLHFIDCYTARYGSNYSSIQSSIRKKCNTIAQINKESKVHIPLLRNVNMDKNFSNLIESSIKHLNCTYSVTVDTSFLDESVNNYLSNWFLKFSNFKNFDYSDKTSITCTDLYSPNDLIRHSNSLKFYKVNNTLDDLYSISFFDVEELVSKDLSCLLDKLPYFSK